MYGFPGFPVLPLPHHTVHYKMPCIWDVLPVSRIPDSCNVSVPEVLFFAFPLHSHALTSETIYAISVSLMCKTYCDHNFRCFFSNFFQDLINPLIKQIIRVRPLLWILFTVCDRVIYRFKDPKRIRLIIVNSYKRLEEAGRITGMACCSDLIYFCKQCIQITVNRQGFTGNDRSSPPLPRVSAGFC